MVERQLREREEGIRIVVTDGSSMELGQCLLGGVLKALGQQVAAPGVFGREAQLPVRQDVAGRRQSPRRTVVPPLNSYGAEALC